MRSCENWPWWWRATGRAELEDILLRRWSPLGTDDVQHGLRPIRHAIGMRLRHGISGAEIAELHADRLHAPAPRHRLRRHPRQPQRPFAGTRDRTASLPLYLIKAADSRRQRARAPLRSGVMVHATEAAGNALHEGEALVFDWYRVANLLRGGRRGAPLRRDSSARLAASPSFRRLDDELPIYAHRMAYPHLVSREVTIDCTRLLGRRRSRLRSPDGLGSTSFAGSTLRPARRPTEVGNGRPRRHSSGVSA